MEIKDIREQAATRTIDLTICSIDTALMHLCIARDYLDFLHMDEHADKLRKAVGQIDDIRKNI